MTHHAPTDLRRIRAPDARRRRCSASSSRCCLAAPLLAVPATFLTDGFEIDEIVRLLLPDALRTSLVLAVGVGTISLVVGGGLAVLVSFYDFPGRRWLDWALVLPMAMPSYVLVYVRARPVRPGQPRCSRTCSAAGCGSPASAAPAGPSSCSAPCSTRTCTCWPAARSSGSPARRSRRPAAWATATAGPIWRVAVPLARPALAAGTALVVMEALADFGTVDLLGVQALTSAIYRVWNGAFDQAAGLPAGHGPRRARPHRCSCSNVRCAAGPATTRRSAGATRWYRSGCAAGGAGWRRSRRCALLLVGVRAPRGPARRLVDRDDRRRHGRSRAARARSSARCCSPRSPPRPRSPPARSSPTACGREPTAHRAGVGAPGDARLRDPRHRRGRRRLRAAGLGRPPPRRRRRRRLRLGPRAACSPAPCSAW